MSKKVESEFDEETKVKEEKPYTPFYYYIIRYGIFLIPCTAILLLGIFLVHYGYNKAMDAQSAETANLGNEQNEQISENAITAVVPKTEQSMEDLSQSGDLKVSSDFVFKLRSLSTKLKTFDASKLDDAEKAKLQLLVDDFETYLDTMSSKTTIEATQELESLSLRCDELLAIIEFRELESDLNDYGYEVPSIDEIGDMDEDVTEQNSNTVEETKE